MGEVHKIPYVSKSAYCLKAFEQYCSFILICQNKFKDACELQCWFGESDKAVR